MNSTSIYKRTEVIGRGKFGVVYKAYNKQSKQVVAIKVLNLDTDEDELIDVQQEIQFLTELKNVPNITHYYGSILNDTKLWIIMDYCAGGSLRTLLKAGVLEERYIAIVVRELLFTLSAVHKLGVIHRDLKAANILISKEGNVQLCDFGVAAKLTSNSSKRTTMAGTPYWMAPEVIRTGDSYNSKADIWSLGITIYEIATGNPPYCDKDASWAMQLISKQTPPRLEGREYSLALKECIALCLDENPDERPSADDMMKCKLMKTYKNYPTAILKEVISRYLLWRDRNASRDSVFINLEDEQEDSVDALVDKSLHGGYQDSLNHQIQVKWDFDSLSSREYIMENDIDLDNVDQQYNNDYDTAQNNGDYNNYSTLPTLKAPTTFGRNQSTLAMNGSSNNNSNTNLKTMNTSKPSTEVPKSLQMLFEDSTEDNEQLTAPTIPNINERMESPTIEIPDMDSLSQLPTSTANSSLNSTANSSHPPLNKPPTLYHSQSASGSLESRFSSQNTSPNEGAGRPRKKTISNTMGANLSIPLQQAVAGAAPHTPPYSTASVVRTPSPKVPGTAGLAGAINVSKTGSPSKMKALQSNSNPLLQPINMKLETNITGANNSNTTSHPPVQAPPQLLNQQSMPNIPTTSSLSQQAGNLKGKRSKPGFIQMPTPSNALSNLSALTNEPQDNENVNQFGINPAQAAAMQISMTPVTEKEPPQFFPTINDESKETAPAAPAQSRSHHNSLLSHKKSAANSSTHNLSTLAASSSSGAAPSSNVMLTRGNSVNVPLSLNINGASANSAHSNGNFPAIPSINGELFLDSVNKQKLVNELDVMIKLFNQGLEVLEENL
ncbi:Serine/threonine-protein kinase KIC1 [Candida viswanathii]|uniref:non-specific serine/threonine protein kinase n=1 Tax=Candida viswanathii TaxID=5486 RepID=A0A367YPD1_9ASCO|nr:Serine/threonine-protein kinase KIC1 [Candida viswanathii]